MRERLPHLVYVVKPACEDRPRWAREVILHFEHLIKGVDTSRSLDTKAVELGLESLGIEVKPRTGAIAMVSRLALSSRLRAWIVSEEFGTWGPGYTRMIEQWLVRHGMSDKARARVNYTNVLLPDAVLFDPLSCGLHAHALAEQDVWNAVARLQESEVVYG